MKNYVDEIITLKQFITESKPQLAANAKRAAEYLKQFYANIQDNELIVITVEGYYCIACLKDSFAPYELAKTVAPFDEERIYPIQELVTQYAFKYYNFNL